MAASLYTPSNSPFSRIRLFSSGKYVTQNFYLLYAGFARFVLAQKGKSFQCATVYKEMEMTHYILFPNTTVDVGYVHASDTLTTDKQSLGHVRQETGLTHSCSACKDPIVHPVASYVIDRDIDHQSTEQN